MLGNRLLKCNAELHDKFTVKLSNIIVTEAEIYFGRRIKYISLINENCGGNLLY